MASALDIQKIEQVFTFPFKDPRWVTKLAIAVGFSLLNFLIIPIFIFSGYGYRTMKRVIVDKQPPGLPEWDDWGGLIKDGLRLYGAGLIYTLPAILVFLVTGVVLLFSFIPAADHGTFEPWMAVLWLSFPIGFTLVMILAIPGQVFGQVAISHLVATDRFSAAFQLKELWSIFRANVGRFFLTWLITYAASMALIFVSQFLAYIPVFCLVYPLVIVAGSVYLALVSYALYAQVYVEAVAKQGGAR